MPDEKKQDEVQAKEVVSTQGDSGLTGTQNAVQEPKAPEPKDVSFYLLKCRKWRTLLAIGKARVELKGENSIITIPVTDGLYAEKIAYLRKHKGNQRNGGTEFVELSDQDAKPGGSCLLDSLLDLGKESLLNVLSDCNPKNRALSRGALMMLILEEKGSI